MCVNTQAGVDNWPFSFYQRLLDHGGILCLSKPGIHRVATWTQSRHNGLYIIGN